MIICEVGNDQIKDRIDAEFYKPQYVYFEQKLSELSSRILGELLSEIVRDPMGYGFDYVEKGIPYYRVDDLQNPFLGDDRTVFISKEDHNKLQKTMLKSGDILMAVRGSTIGRLGLYIGKDYEGNISPNVIILRPKKKELSAYIAVCLLSKIGKSQIERATAGTGQPTITLPYIRTIRIPIPSVSLQSRIEYLIREAYKKLQEADTEYKKAEGLLNETLGIGKSEFQQNKNFETNFDNVEETMRFDAEYYLPEYAEIPKLLKNSGFEIRRLNELGKEVVRKVNPLEKPSTKFTYIEIGDINISSGVIETKTILGHEAPPNARRLLKKGDLVISRVRPTRGAITIIPEELDNSIGSTAFYVLSPESPLRELLFLYLRSSLGLNQLGRSVVGAMYPTLKSHYVDNIMVALTPNRIQQKISSLVKESFKLRKEAKGVLDKAKKEIEGFIEYQKKVPWLPEQDE